MPDQDAPRADHDRTHRIGPETRRLGPNVRSIHGYAPDWDEIRKKLGDPFAPCPPPSSRP